MKNLQQLFLMKWENGAQDNFVYANDAKERCPQIVIQYYEAELKKAMAHKAKNQSRGQNVPEHG